MFQHFIRHGRMQLPSWHIWVRLQNTAIALGLREKLSLVCTTQLSEDALQAAKNKLLVSTLWANRPMHKLLRCLAGMKQGLGIEFDTQFQQEIASLTAAVAQAACQYLQQPYVSLVGPEEAVNSLVAQAAIGCLVAVSDICSKKVLHRR